MPFRLDAYRGCPSKCAYCFVSSRGGNYSKDFQYANPTLIQRLLDLAADQSFRPKNVNIECLKRRMPLHFGGMSDPLLIPNRYRHITLDILKALDKYNYPTLISTKANIMADAEFTDIFLGKSHFAFQISFSTFNDHIASIVEPIAPRPSERLKGAEVALKKGNWVACRLQPYFPGQDVDSIVSYISNLGFRHITIEHFKLPFDGNVNIKLLNTVFNMDLLSLFPKEKRIMRGREFEMPYEFRLQEIKSFEKAAKKYKIPIGIGDNGFQHLSTSQCCCGIDSLRGFENWFKHNIMVAMKRVQADNVIRYESIVGEWTPQADISRMINSKTRLKNSLNTVRNQIKIHWDNNRQFSPRMFYNVVPVHSKTGVTYYLRNAKEQEKSN
jgi:DNA repair photolyase